jgi:hypothetical protein
MPEHEYKTLVIPRKVCVREFTTRPGARRLPSAHRGRAHDLRGHMPRLSEGRLPVRADGRGSPEK